MCVGHLGKTDVVYNHCHDSPAELSQPCEVLDWRKGECDLIPQNRRILWRWSATTLLPMNAFTSLGPLMDKLGNGGKGDRGNTRDEIDFSVNSITPSVMAAGVR